jgi:hypothetical protein
VNKGLNNNKLREIITTTGNGNKHTPNTIDLLVSLTMMRWKHAKKRIDVHEAYYLLDGQRRRNIMGTGQNMLPTSSPVKTRTAG